MVEYLLGWTSVYTQKREKKKVVGEGIHTKDGKKDMMDGEEDLYKLSMRGEE